MRRQSATASMMAVRLAAVALCLVLAPARACAADNLLLNGNLASGSGNSPDQWRTESWDQKPEVTRYRWSRTAGGPGELEIYNLKPNDARYQQTVTMGAGWYHFSAEVRTENVGLHAAGATISILEDAISSPDLRETNGWRRLGFYLKVGKHGADVEVGCRLGGFSSLNTGRAFFRDLRAAKIAAPAPGAGPLFDLETIRKQAGGNPIGRPWSLVVVFVALAAVAVLGWRAFGEPVPEITSRAEARRRDRKAAPR